MNHDPAPAAEAATGARARKRGARTVLIVLLSLAAYLAVALWVAAVTERSGSCPSGSDTMFYIHRGNLLYHAIREERNWYPLLDYSWYNGVETFRYWSPLSAYILAGCQFLAGGNEYDGYVVFVGIFYFLNAAVWLVLGLRHRRPLLGAYLGLIWFFVPNNAFMLYGEGVIARAQSMAVLPVFVSAVYDYLAERKFSAVPAIMLSFFLITMCHTGFAGMLALTTLLFLALYRALNRKKLRRTGSAAVVAAAMVLGFLATGLWLYASLQGGITTKDSSSIMANFFQSLNKTLNPLYGIGEGYWNRWDDPAVNLAPYFGPAAFLLGVFGVLFGGRETAPAFATAVLVCLLTSEAAYPFLKLLPGSQYLWMLRFLSLALTFLFVGFFRWRRLRRGLALLFALALGLECAAALPLVMGDGSGTTPYERYDRVEEETLIGLGKELTSQRFSAIEPYASIPDGIYVIAGYGEDAAATSYGQGVQAAANYRNIVQLNDAAEQGNFLYLFDRALEQGNDTVLVPVCHYGEPEEVAGKLDAAAERVGYALAAANDGYRLYHYDAPETFGVVSRFRAIGIGSTAPMISLSYPAVEETESVNLNDYSFEELREYAVVYLSGFTYDDRAQAETLVRRLADAGVQVVIMADGIPAEESSGTKTFLGVDCESIAFQHGYPPLETVNGTLHCDLLPSEYADWRTVYLNGLDEVWGSIEEDGRSLPFYGTVENDNIVMIGLNLTYYYFLTGDEGLGQLLSYALRLSPLELPERSVVPLSIEYGTRSLTITSAYDGVDTTLAYHDIFSSGQEIRSRNYLLCVDAGTTEITLEYPFLLEGSVLSLSALLLSAVFLLCLKRQMNKQRRQEGARQHHDEA